jgi:hypothetical protein
MKMLKRILAITFIYICTAAAWFILAGTTFFRTETQDSDLKERVGNLWGTKQEQKAPRVCVSGTTPGGTLPLEASDIAVDLQLEHRKKGLQWYSTYAVSFGGKYKVKNAADQRKTFELAFELPVKTAIYDNFHFVVGGRQTDDISMNTGGVTKTLVLEPGQVEQIEISYNSQGMDEWAYDFGDQVNQIKNFSLTVNTNFDGIDFPTDSVSPTSKENTAEGWKLAWKYDNLLTGVRIAASMPHKLNPGPWVAKVTAAAPVSLFLFFFLLFVLTTVRKIKIHPMNYFFIGAAFFSFHLLLAYLVDHVSIHLAFWICAAVSIFLVVSYMRLVVGKRFAFVEVGLCQAVYLVFFSYTFFFTGFTGLAITILCIATLFAVMQFTGKVDWDDVFRKNGSNRTPQLAPTDNESS